MNLFNKMKSFFGDIVKPREKIDKNVDKRNRSLKIYSIGSVLVLTAILLAANLLFETAFSSRLTWDHSSTQTYSLSDVSKGIVSRLDRDIEITGLFERTSAAESTYADFIPLLDDYAAESNGRITVRYVDPVKYPSILTELDPDGTYGLVEGSFVVKCGNKLKVVKPDDCYSYSYYYEYDEYMKTANNVEYNFTGAITFVTSDTVNKIYFTSNHAEDAHTQLSTMLSSDGYETEDLSTVSLTAIPSDCSLLIINNPKTDISTDDISILKDYLTNGGNLIVIADFESAGLTYGNLNEVLHTMNLNLTNARICENDMSYRIQATSGYTSYADVQAGSFSASAVEKSIILSNARGVSVFDSPSTYISTEPIITTSASSVLEENGDAESVSAAGAQNAAMYAKNTENSLASETVVIGTTYLTSDEFINVYSLDDPQVIFFGNIVNHLVGTTNTTQVKSKAFPSYTLTKLPTANEQGIWSVFLIAFVPMTFIIIGIAVYRKRRHM